MRARNIVKLLRLWGAITVFCKVCGVEIHFFDASRETVDASKIEKVSSPPNTERPSGDVGVDRGDRDSDHRRRGDRWGRRVDGQDSRREEKEEDTV